MPRFGGWTVDRMAAVAGLISLAILAGALSARSPFTALLWGSAAAIVTLAFFAPATHLTLFALVTAIVPFGLQNRIGVGLIPSDVFLLSGVLAAVLRLSQTSLDRRRFVVLALTSAFLLVVALQVLHGLQAGRGISQVGFEFRVLLGFATVLIATSLLTTPEGRRRVCVGLLLAGLVLGLWGLAQWMLNIPEIAESGAGVRAGVRFTTAGKGQLQGGLYGFPIAVVLSAAALVLGQVRAWSTRALLAAVFVLNLVCLLLTYERTFWIATVVGFAVIAVKAGWGQRARALLGASITCLLLFGALMALAPGDLNAAGERLLSIGQHRADDSVRIRLLESRHVMAEIESHPLVGSGLGATIYMGRPWQQVRPRSEWYIHNGYLWLAWKVGIVAALLLFIVLAWATVVRCAPSGDPLFDAIRSGSQAALVVILISSLTFPAFNSFAITATMGILAAIAFAGHRSTHQQEPAAAAGVARASA